MKRKEAVQKYQRATSQAATLKKEKEKLTERVTLASRLDATDINVTPENSRGKLARRIKKISAIRRDFQDSEEHYRSCRRKDGICTDHETG